MATVTGTLSAQKRFDLFQKALAAEKSDGNLNDAIALYQQAIREAGTDRALAAKAWLRIGECYQPLGDKQAQGALERVAHEFTEQTEAVAEARAKLDAMNVSPRSADNGAPRQIATLSSAVVLNGLTPDGQLIGTDWNTGDIIVRDPSGRFTRMIAGRNKAASWGKEPLVSPDRSHLAYAWYDPDLPATAASFV